VLHTFSGGSDGAAPQAGLIRDAAGNLYGTIAGGGNGCGVIFKLDSSGEETVLYAFTGGADGESDFGAGLVSEGAGEFYGQTGFGGSFGSGVVFKVDAAGKETVLHSFNGTDGAVPVSHLLLYHGSLYGTAEEGGAYGTGVVFKLPAQ
jgi:uncharacterized repeat protein (TIGR03803 family)